MNGQRFTQYKAVLVVCLFIAAIGALAQSNDIAPGSSPMYPESDWGWQEDFRLEMPWDEGVLWKNLGISPYAEFPVAEPSGLGRVPAQPAVTESPLRVDRFTRRVREALANVESLKTQAQSDALQGFLPPSTQTQYSLSLESLDTFTSGWLSPNDPLRPSKPNPLSLDIEEILRATLIERPVTVSEDSARPANKTEVLLPEDPSPRKSDLSSHEVQRKEVPESNEENDRASTFPLTSTQVDDEKPGKLDRPKGKLSETGGREETLLGNQEDIEPPRGLAQKTALERLERNQPKRSALSSQQLRSRATGSSLAPGQGEDTGSLGSIGKRPANQTRMGPQYYRTITGDVRQPDYTYRFQGPRRYSIGEREYGNQPSYQGLPYYRRRN